MAYAEDLEDLLNCGYSLALMHHEEDAFDLIQNAYLMIVFIYLSPWSFISNCYYPQYLNRKTKTKKKW